MYTYRLLYSCTRDVQLIQPKSEGKSCISTREDVITYFYWFDQISRIIILNTNQTILQGSTWLHWDLPHIHAPQFPWCKLIIMVVGALGWITFSISSRYIYHILGDIDITRHVLYLTILRCLTTMHEQYNDIYHNKMLIEHSPRVLQSGN